MESNVVTPTSFLLIPILLALQANHGLPGRLLDAVIENESQYDCFDIFVKQNCEKDLDCRNNNDFPGFPI